MYQTPRVAVLTLALLVAVPAPAQTHSTLSVKAWDAKSDQDQLSYLGFCVARLAAAVGKADKPLADKILYWYAHKEPGQKVTEGSRALLTAIFSLEERAKNNRSIDLAGIDIEDLVLQTTKKQFILPAAACSEAGGRACAGKSIAAADRPPPGSGTGQPAPVKPAAPPPAKPKKFDRVPDDGDSSRDAGVKPAAPAAPSQPEAPANDEDFFSGGLKHGGYEVSEFDPKWLGGSRIVYGTVGRVTVDREGTPRYVILYFRESPDGTFTAHSPDPAMLRSRYGYDFSGLIGKRIYMTGEIQPFRDAKGSDLIVDLDELEIR